MISRNLANTPALLLETIEGAAEASEGAGFTGPAYLKDIQAGIKFFVRNPLDQPDPDLLQQLVFGSEAPDQIVGGTQNDKLFGDGQDFLSGATGIDFLEGIETALMMSSSGPSARRVTAKSTSVKVT